MPSTVLNIRKTAPKPSLLNFTEGDAHISHGNNGLIPWETLGYLAAGKQMCFVNL